MPLKPLIDLLERAIKARDATGAEAVADRLLLFGPVVNALQHFTTREASRSGINQKIHKLARELGAELRAIEIAASSRGPSEEHTRRYYAAIIRLQAALKELDAATEAITIFRNLGDS